MKNIIRYISLLSLLLFGISVYSLSSTLRGLSASDGLSDLLVNSIYKDSLGFVWIGTGTSLERFDGIHLKHYPIPGNNEKLKRVNAIVEMPGKQLWIGNGMGLWRLNREQNSLEQLEPDLISCAVYSLLHDGKGTLYIGSAKGVFIYRSGKMEHFLLNKNTLSECNHVTGLSSDRKGNLWMATKQGLFALHLPEKQIKSYACTQDGKQVCALRNIARIGDMLYLGTMEEGILSFDINTGKFDSFVDVGSNLISSLSSDGQRVLYVGTDGNGVHFIDTKSKRVIRTMRHEAGHEGSLRSNSVYSLLVDREGIIWIGFYQFGLDYTLFQSGLFSTYTYPPYFDSKDMPIRAISIREHEKLIGTRNGLFYIDEKRGRFKSFQSSGLRSGMIFCTLYFEGVYYIGTYGGGLYILDPRTLELKDFEPGEPQPFSQGHIFCLKQDAERNLWIGTSQGLYCYRNNKQTAHYTSANSKLPEGNVYEIYFDSEDKGWICTENGLCIWDPSAKTLRTDIFPESFIHKEKIRVVYEDSEHNLYFVPDRGAMCISDVSMNRFHRLQPGTPLEGRDGMFIIEDHDRQLWIGTSNGLFRYDKKDHFVPYNFVDGIPGSIFTLCPPVCDSNGNLWFGNSKGLLFLDVSLMNGQKHISYPIRITDVYINGKPISPSTQDSMSDTRGIELQSSQKNITFRISDFSYTAPAFMSYEYKLEGEDKKWMSITGSSEITYYNLASGAYVFKVRRVGQPDSETRLNVRIASSLDTWIYGGIAVLLLLTGTIYFKYRGKKTRLFPETTTNIDGTSVSERQKAEQKTTAEEKYKTIKVSSEECKRLAERLEAVMQTEKPYMHPELKIADLAASIGTSTHMLSYLFNQYLERNYYDYINDYRIMEFKRLVNTEEYAKYTLSALAELCGFSSRASFFRYFKKTTGITPNEYIRSIGKTD